VAFGEAMLRIAPLEGETFSKTNKPSAATNSLLTVGGDELNVAVALSLLGISSEWVSVLPSGPLGNIVIRSAQNNSVSLANAIIVQNSDIGLFFVLPEEKRVHYQRYQSAWAQQQVDFFDWEKIFTSKPKLWYHITGISPMTGDIPAHNWIESVKTAIKHNVPISMDFNHRPQLGTIDKLWNIIKPYIKSLNILILSQDSIIGLSQLHGIYDSNLSSEKLILELHKLLGVNLAYCHKYRNVQVVDGKQSEVQTRFSVIAHDGVLFSTEKTPIYHIPKDECGGGSAWSAGYIASMMEIKSKGEEKINWINVLRRADLLAALCQETVGDHSIIKASTLLSFEQKFHNQSADISSNEVVSVIHNPSTTQFFHNVLKGIKDAKVIPILRAKNSQLTIERGKELIDLGCKCLEITLDTPGILDILKEVKSYIQSTNSSCTLGVGTITDKSQIISVVGLVDFAISPVNPTGFIDECHKYNILAIPAASSPQELWNTKLAGAWAVKLFPSQLWSPAALKEVLNVGPLGELNVIATGGITPEKYLEWMSAGAVAVGMGSRLCGTDLKFSYDDPQFATEHKLWKENGRNVAKELFLGLNK